jgi:hypothetical protein
VQTPIYVVDSPGATVFHLLPDCAALQQAEHPIVTEYADGGPTAQVATETRGLLPTCERCEDAVRKASGGYGMPVADGSEERPFVLLGEWKQNFVTLALYEGHVEIEYPLADNEAIPLADIVELGHTTWIPLLRDPRIDIAYQLDGEIVETFFVLDNDDDPAAVEAEIAAARDAAVGTQAPAPQAGTVRPALPDDFAAESDAGEMRAMGTAPIVPGKKLPASGGLPSKALQNHYSNAETSNNGCAQAALATLVMSWQREPTYHRIRRLQPSDRVDLIWQEHCPDTPGQWFGTTPAFLCAAAQDLGFRVGAFYGTANVARLKRSLADNVPVIVLLDTGKFRLESWFKHHYAVAYAYTPSEVLLKNMDGLGLPSVVEWDLFVQAWQAHALGVLGPQFNYLGIAAR